MTAALRSTDRWEPAVHALVERLVATALTAADESDSRLREGTARGTLEGIPVAVKDLIDIQGVHTRAGSRQLAENVASTDATVVRRLRAAGAVLIAKTNTHEFALGALTPPTRNPWDVERMPGGSSGGSAAAVATGMAMAALGTDTAGSIREPACLCGLSGLKPSFGRVSCHGVIPLPWTLDTVGPIARTPRDCLHVLRAIESPDRADPRARPIVDDDDRPIELRGLRVGVVSELHEVLQPDVAHGFARTLSAIEGAGAKLSEVRLGDPDEIVAAVFLVLAGEAAAYHRRWLREAPEHYGLDVLRYLRVGAGILAADYLDAQRLRRRMTAHVDGLLRDVDVLLTPGQLCVAPRVDDDIVQFPGGVDWPRDLTLIRPLCAFSYTGHPAAAIPVEIGESGLPVGIQLVGRPFSDVALLAVGAQIHDALGWRWTDPTLPGASTSG